MLDWKGKENDSMLEPHPLALLFPAMKEVEFAALKDDIDRRGQDDPITLFEGMVLDGLNRNRACQELKKEPKTVEFNGTYKEAAEFVRAKNALRRHLKPSQLAIIAAQMATMKRGRPKKNGGEGDHLFTRAEAANILQVGEESVMWARKVLREGDAETIEQVRSGLLSLEQAVQKIKPPAPPKLDFIAEFARRLDHAMTDPPSEKTGKWSRDGQLVRKPESKLFLKFIAIRLRDVLGDGVESPLDRARDFVPFYDDVPGEAGEERKPVSAVDLYLAEQRPEEAKETASVDISLLNEPSTVPLRLRRPPAEEHPTLTPAEAAELRKQLGLKKTDPLPDWSRTSKLEDAPPAE